MSDILILYPVGHSIGALILKCSANYLTLYCNTLKRRRRWQYLTPKGQLQSCSLVGMRSPTQCMQGQRSGRELAIPCGSEYRKQLQRCSWKYHGYRIQLIVSTLSERRNFFSETTDCKNGVPSFTNIWDFSCCRFNLLLGWGFLLALLPNSH